MENAPLAIEREMTQALARTLIGILEKSLNDIAPLLPPDVPTNQERPALVCPVPGFALRSAPDCSKPVHGEPICLNGVKEAVCTLRALNYWLGELLQESADQPELLSDG